MFWEYLGEKGAEKSDILVCRVASNTIIVIKISRLHIQLTEIIQALNW